jgi:hypothetical protein
MARANNMGVLSEQGWAMREHDLGPSEPWTDTVRLTLQDMSDKQIARGLGIFLDTTCTRSDHRLPKCGPQDRTELLAHVFTQRRRHRPTQRTLVPLHVDR